MISTAAGSGVPGFSEDGTPAFDAMFDNVRAVAVDRNGNVYIADLGNNRIRKLSPNGIVTTFAGNGGNGISGDGGLATQAQIGQPYRVAVDAGGSVYVVSLSDSRVRKVSPSGIISVFAGCGCNSSLRGDGGPATAADLGNIWDVTVDGIGNVYLATSDRIRRVSPNGTITTVAGGGQSLADGIPATAASIAPTGVAVDSADNTYISQSRVNRLRKVSPSGIITTIAGNGTFGFSGDGGPALLAQVFSESVTVDSALNVYAFDYAAGRVRRISPSGIITTVAGGGQPSDAQLGDGGPATASILGTPYQGAFDSSGNLYVSGVTKIRKLSPTQANTVGCLYSVNAAGVSFGTAGGGSTAQVTAARNDCPWLATSTASWVTITSGPGGIGNGTVSLAIAPNLSATTRTGTIAIAGKAVTISQTGATCALSIGSSQVSVAAGGLSGLVGVSSNLPDCTWTTSSDSPWLFVINGASGRGNGAVSYSVAANNGAARIGTLTIGGQKVTFTQSAAPGFISTFVSFVGSSATGIVPVAASQLVSLYGTLLGPSAGSGAQIGLDGAVTKSSGGTQVFFDGVAAPVLYTGENQVNTVVPCSIVGRPSTQVVVSYQGNRSPAVTLPLAVSAPGIFTADGSGKGQAAVLNQDYSINGPGNPAARGSAVTLYATGIGVTSPCVDGQTYPGNFPPPTLPVIAGVGNSGAQVLYAGQAPFFVTGVAQINIVIPNDTPPGVASLTLVVGGVFSPPGVMIAVK